MLLIFPNGKATQLIFENKSLSGKPSNGRARLLPSRGDVEFFAASRLGRSLALPMSSKYQRAFLMMKLTTDFGSFGESGRVGAGAGKQLIETGCIQEYRLTITKRNIAERVAVTGCFFELVDLRVVTNVQSEILRKTCPPCILRETEELLRRD